MIHLICANFRPWQGHYFCINLLSSAHTVDIQRKPHMGVRTNRYLAYNIMCLPWYNKWLINLQFFFASVCVHCSDGNRLFSIPLLVFLFFPCFHPYDIGCELRKRIEWSAVVGQQQQKVVMVVQWKKQIFFNIVEKCLGFFASIWFSLKIDKIMRWKHMLLLCCSTFLCTCCRMCWHMWAFKTVNGCQRRKKRPSMIAGKWNDLIVLNHWKEGGLIFLSMISN